MDGENMKLIFGKLFIPLKVSARIIFVHFIVVYVFILLFMYS